MKMSKILSVILVFALCFACFAGCSGSTGYTSQNTEYVIGLSGPLTGSAAVYGTAVQNSAQMAVDEINAAGGLNGVMFKLIATDDANDATKVSTNYSSMYEQGMQVSLGTVTTTPGLEFTNLSAEDNVFFLTPSASGNDIPKNANGFQMCFADGNQGGVAAAFVNENCKGQTIGIFYKSDDAYSNGIYKQFKDNLDDSITTIETVFTDANATDFSTQISTLKNCTFIFMPMMHRDNKLVWVNSIIYDYQEQLSGGHSDDTALTVSEDYGWGWLADRNFDFIQTDWTMMLVEYLKKSGKYYKK